MVWRRSPVEALGDFLDSRGELSGADAVHAAAALVVARHLADELTPAYAVGPLAAQLAALVGLIVGDAPEDGDPAAEFLREFEQA